MKEREALEAAKTAAATGPITNKILELSEESITDVVRDTFTRETERLRLERVTIARTRADKGALLHQPKLVGARQEVKLPRVFSEGERTALGLAAFFTEAHFDGSKSALILDDPVTSLDHIRRGLVAARLAVLAANRQVIVFTHDMAFVADLKRETSGRGVSITERSVTRSWPEIRKPGTCSNNHPWKVKDVPARLDELRRNLAQIKKEGATWDQATVVASLQPKPMVALPDLDATPRLPSDVEGYVIAAQEGIGILAARAADGDQAAFKQLKKCVE